MTKIKKTSGAERIALLVIVAIALLAMVPKELWFGGVIFGLIIWAVRSSTKSVDPSPAVSKSSKVNRSLGVSQMTAETPVSVATSGSGSSGFRLPPAPKGSGTARWLKPSEVVEHAGLKLAGGLFYFGSFLKSSSGGKEPSLIDPKQYVAPHGDFTERQTNYWPNYSEISASARRAYLNWLAEGRCHPEADIGYVFIFFYGLERRAILDAASDEAAKADLAPIAEELRQLLGIYGEKSNSFRRYAAGLLDWIELVGQPTQLYKRVLPVLPRSYELPVVLRLALGQTVMDGVPVPATLALAWARLEPGISLRTPAVRCADEFDRLFLQRYAEWFGAGIELPRNRTKLKFIYQPASAGLRGLGEIKLTFGDTPDVSALTAPVKKLADLVESCTSELESFSRQLGRNPEARTSLDGLLQLPATLWPDSARQALEGLKSRMRDGFLVLGFGEVLGLLPGGSTLTREKVLGLARALESLNIAMEPDVLAGAKVPKPENKVVLFLKPVGETELRASPAYQVATLTLQLASAVAVADGQFTEAEVDHLRGQIRSWQHMTPAHQQRLMAQLQLLVEAPVSLAGLKKQLEPLEAGAKEAIATFMATLAQVDGVVSPEEVKLLEKVYKALGIDSQKVFSDVHQVAAGAPKSATSKDSGFRLDPERIAALQKDTEKVSALLATIFTEDEAPPLPATASSTEVEPVELTHTHLLGLDDSHSSLARLLISRPQWSRQELLDAAADLELMLDGALERINEAALDTFDMPLLEGDDPVEVNSEALERIAA